MAQKKIEKCAYCNSTQIQHPQVKSIRHTVFFIISAWFSPDCKREKLEKCECVGCCNCNRDYQTTIWKRDGLPTLQKSIKPLNSALQNFRDIFGNNDFDDWIKHVSAIVFTESGAMHIIFRLCKIKAYLDCQKIEGRFVIISVEVVY